MTQPTDRPGIDQITSDGLDQLYAERDHAVRVARSAAFDTAKALTAQLLAEQRAEQAEATLTAVRDLHQPARDWSWKPFGCDHHGAHSNPCGHCGTCYPCPTIAVLDQHGQTPA